MGSVKNDSIQSREDFIIFVKNLLEDLHKNPEAWENKNLESFIRALAAWIEDMDGYYTNQGKAIPQQINWKFISDMLLAAKFYE